jgi:hypothetical protein
LIDFARRNGVFFGPEQGSNKVTAAYWKLGPGEKLGQSQEDIRTSSGEAIKTRKRNPGNGRD